MAGSWTPARPRRVDHDDAAAVAAVVDAGAGRRQRAAGAADLYLVVAAPGVAVVAATAGEVEALVALVGEHERGQREAVPRVDLRAGGGRPGLRPAQRRAASELDVLQRAHRRQPAGGGRVGAASRKQPSNSPASMPETSGEVSLQYPGPVRSPLISSGMLMALSTTWARPVSAAIHSLVVNTLPVRGLTGLPANPLKS